MHAGLDPRVLAALAAAQRVNAPGGQPQGRNAAAIRRSVDMGMLAHAAAMGGAGRHGGNSAGFPKHFGEQTSIPEGSPVSLHSCFVCEKVVCALLRRQYSLFQHTN